MGQYYVAVFDDRHQNPSDKVTVSDTIQPWGYNNGAKLTEHSYHGTEFINAVEAHIYQHPTRVVWAGDYADPEPNGRTLYHVAGDHSTVEPDTPTQPIRYLINHNTGEYIDLEAARIEGALASTSGLLDLICHPLPLLTVEGNGRGGGDYRLNDPRLGTWARHLISTENADYDVSHLSEVDGYFDYDD